MPAHRLSLCKSHYIQWFETYTRRAIDKFEMIQTHEKVMVAVSGGKDSLALWHLLAGLGYETVGFYIELGIPDQGYSSNSQLKAQSFAEKIGQKLVIARVEEEMGAGIPEISKSTYRKTCSVCGLSKRHLMNRAAMDEGVDVLATGHNLDDETASLFGNMINWDIGYLGKQSPVLAENAVGLRKKIKPFCYFTEKQVAMYALLSGIDYLQQDCPHSVTATSLRYKEILNQMEHQSPGMKRRFFDRYLQNQGLFQAEQTQPELRPCARCGMPTSIEVCSYCKTVERAKCHSRESGNPVG
ncbi:MAG: TIGR00269 family protein [Candidatus Omnitrophica bacterium]|nr:TIGR00269 family protein [Candidatus Omnitrophota bacterium]